MSAGVDIVAADDLVEALFAQFPPNEPRFTTSAESIHTAFYKLKEKYPKVFRDFVFDVDRPFPYCEDIEFTLSCLVGTSLLSTQNPYLERFLVTDRLREHFESSTSSRITLPDEQLEEISAQLEEMLER